MELHLDRIFPERDIVAMKTNNIASYADVLVTCMRQNPRWILLSEVRSAEAVMAVRDSISSGHNILSTIHADKAESIPSRLYSLLESSIDMDQFLRSIHRYVQLGVHIKGYYSKELQRFKREVSEVVEFYVDDNNRPKCQIIYKRTPDGKTEIHNPTQYLLGYLESQGVIMPPDILVKQEFREQSTSDEKNNFNTMNYPSSVQSNVVQQSNLNSMNTKNNVTNSSNISSNGERNMTNLASINSNFQNGNVGVVENSQTIHSRNLSANQVNGNNNNFSNFAYLNNVGVQSVPYQNSSMNYSMETNNIQNAHAVNRNNNSIPVRDNISSSSSLGIVNSNKIVYNNSNVNVE